MIDTDFDRILDLLENFWPKWNHSEPELAIWRKQIQPYDYDLVKIAIEQYFTDRKQNYTSPVVKPIMTRISELQKRRNRGLVDDKPKDEPGCLFAVSLVVNGKITKRTPFFMPHKLRMPRDPDIIMAAAQKQCTE